MRLPRGRVVFTYPAFLVAEIVKPPNDLQVPFVAVLERSLGGMRRHREVAKFHCFLLLSAQVDHYVRFICFFVSRPWPICHCRIEDETTPRAAVSSRTPAMDA